LKTFGGTAGHQNLVLSLAVSGDGTFFASGSSDNSARIWDFPVSKALREFAGADAFNTVAISPDGLRVAGAGKDGVVKVWTTADGKQAFALDGHKGPVNSVVFSANNQILASAGADQTLRFWNPTNGQLMAVVGAHTGSVTSVALAPGNNAAYTGGADGTLKVWTVPPLAARPLAPPHGDTLTQITLPAANAPRASPSADKTVRLSTFANGAQVKAFAGPAAAVNSAALSPDAKLVAGGTADNRLFLWNNADAKVLSQVIAHAGPVTGVAFHPSNTQLLTSSGDGTLKLWAMPPAPPRVLTQPENVVAAAHSADAKKLTTGSSDKILRSWNLTNNQIERQYTGHAGVVTAVALSANAALLASGGDDTTIRFWNQT